MSAQDSLTVLTYTQNAPPKVMAKQWLHLYQQGPVWVRPMVLSGTLANGYLAWSCSEGDQQRLAYVAALAVFFATFPLTLAHFEPGINGACKWKVESLLASDGFSLQASNGFPSPFRHSATESSKKWADSASIAELVASWGRLNHVRWVMSLFAAAASGYATFCF
ncbi:hypothetical protein B0T24DRAFT_528702 [Lasiosphaeria ovina]|uniref:Uncharacterized protein n=1 Tax=Lasiosphaeria ovina TaxID=92902 RepID=A0AAE0KE49_9PEZI|nr:hypothetical protein B0T24DRAFT_528702 [Lasiosphaeria ovina]